MLGNYTEICDELILFYLKMRLSKLCGNIY